MYGNNFFRKPQDKIPTNYIMIHEMKLIIIMDVNSMSNNTLERYQY